ncbi:CBS domain-containing protein [Dactylosporangium sp. NBC_01737]|uniref:CBS domain-containing protein n=1 Tax=Dactylosporangium sp. NBC_01737 TaxID=2975959 RepID=UPI002E161F25|nr:CBS domain-containing protein [Dactylosporangium sp. NBC_01737]
MPQSRVRDVMTTQVVTARDDTPVADIAALLTGHSVSAVPIVDRFAVVVGVVSWTDLQDEADLDEPVDGVRGRRWRRRTSALPRWSERTAAQVMSAPPVTIGPSASVPAAGRAMYRRNVGRLLVVDRTGRLRGIVTRRDLLKVHARLDTVIRDEVMQRVLRRTLLAGPGSVRVTVDDAVVTLVGRVPRKTTAVAAVGLTEAVEGVTEVVDRLTFDVDDTVAPADPPETGSHCSRQGGLIGRRPARIVGHAAGGDLHERDGRQAMSAVAQA